MHARPQAHWLWGVEAVLNVIITAHAGLGCIKGRLGRRWRVQIDLSHSLQKALGEAFDIVRCISRLSKYLTLADEASLRDG